MAPMFVNTCRVCSWTPPATSWPVAGSSGICPDRNSRLPALMAWEYGPIAAGAAGLVTASRITGFAICHLAFGIRHVLRRLDDLARAQAARADAHALDAAVDHRPDPLKVRLEPPRGGVGGVTDVPPDDRALITNFATLRH